ncbi:patatin-like phospholipase family protein [Flammeovirga kamogawensis]|nr:patatin-like phospholipase family protein [Flammeovirga kamogawensis]
MHIIKTTLLFLLIVMTNSFCIGQHSFTDSLSEVSHNKGRKTVGLVLSGGGAKGIAHVGVIKVLEENGIPIDYIAGTSMGAIVGGFYAAGYTTDELEAFLRDPQFQVWVSGQIDPADEYYFGKQDKGAEWVNFNIELDSNYDVSWDPTIVKDASLNFALSARLYKASYESHYNFDSLQIPFRCIGSDIFERKAVTIKSGSVERAMRASMAVPLAFRPVKIDGKYLFDGGVYNNIPVDVMKEDFNPDMVIAVNLGAHDMIEEYPYENDDIMVKGNVLKYIIMNNTYPEEIDSLKDVYLGVPVDAFSSADFTPVDTLMSIGYNYAQSQIEFIKEKYGDNPRVEPKKSEFKKLYDPTVEDISFVELSDDLNFGQRVFVRNIIKPNRRKDTSIEHLLERYNMLISNNYFSDIDAYFYYDTLDYKPRLHIDVTPNKKIRVGVGGNIASRNIGQAYLNAQLSVFRKSLKTIRVNAFAGAFYSSIKAEVETMYAKALPFSIGGEYILNRWNYGNAGELIFEPRERLDVYRADNYAGIKASTATGRKSKVTMFGGYFWNTDKYDQVVYLENDSNDISLPIDIIGEEQLSGWTFGATWEMNSLNNPTFPTTGKRLKASAKAILSDNKFKIYVGTPITSDFYNPWEMIQVQYEQYFPFKFFTLGIRGHAVASNYQNSITKSTSLANAPAYYPLFDSRSLFTEGFKGPNFIAGGAKIIKNIVGESVRLQLEGHFFSSNVSYESNNSVDVTVVKHDFFDKDYMDYALSGSLIYSSPIGPISCSVSHYNEEDYNYMFLLNIGFLLYNKKILEE